MIAALATSLILTWLHITVVSTLSTPWLVIQFIIITVVLSFRYEQPRFGWQVTLLSGGLFDLFSGLRFGTFLAVFLITALISDEGFAQAERWGISVTTLLTTIISMVLYMLIIGSTLLATVLSTVATLITLYFAILVIDQLRKRVA